MAPSPSLPDLQPTLQDQNLQILEFSITLTATHFKPAVLNLDTLKASAILLEDWELARQPILSNRNAQLTFKNGVSLVAQGNSLTCSQMVRPRGELQVPGLAQRFVEKMPNAGYRAVSIGPKMLLGFGASPTNEARHFILERVIAPGPWREIGQGPVHAKVDFAYTLDRCPLTLSIAEAQLSQPNQPNVPALLFISNFAYPLNSDSPDLLQHLSQRIQGWPQDLQMFQDIVQQRFLGQVDSIFPSRP